MSAYEWPSAKWTPQQIEFDAFQYRHSRSHCARELLEAIAGIAPEAWLGFSPRHAEIDKPACGEEGYVLTVGVFDVRPEVTCPKCRVLMRAVRPQSAPLHERFTIDGIMYYRVGGEPMLLDEYTERVGIRRQAA